MKKLVQLKFEWKYNTPKIILNNHYRNIYVRDTFIDINDQYIIHGLKDFSVTMEIVYDCEKNIFIKELNIRRKRNCNNIFWGFKSRIEFKLERSVNFINS